MTAPPADITDWNPCATCRCAGTCFARCCTDHDTPCQPERLCCAACPEQWHPQHPEGIECVRVEHPLPPLPAPARPVDRSLPAAVPADVQHLADVIADAYMRGIRLGPYTLARAILEAGYRRTIISTSGEPVCQHCHPAPPTFRCRELGHVIHPN